MSEENAGGDGQNGAILNDPVDVIIDKLLRYDSLFAAVSFSHRGWFASVSFFPGGRTG